MVRKITIPLAALILVASCSGRQQDRAETEVAGMANVTQAEVEILPPIEVILEKELLYDRHTLDDSYPYQKGTREFQWLKIRDSLHSLEVAQHSGDVRWATLQNYKNLNGVAPMVENAETNEYNSISDQYGVSRYQSIPLYREGNLDVPERYGRDGALVKHLRDSADYVLICSMIYDGQWYVPAKYVKPLSNNVFTKTIFVDRTNQNIATIEKEGDVWLVRSMNPATTGLHRPPYQHETPLGVYVIQEKKPKMFYTGDGHSRIVGYAPHASRFTRGGYIHGVPLNNPNATDYIEFSPTLGTTPRSHMCVRNATSHAGFIYDWAPALQSLVFVIE